MALGYGRQPTPGPFTIRKRGGEYVPYGRTGTETKIEINASKAMMTGSGADLLLLRASMPILRSRKHAPACVIGPVSIWLAQ